MCCHLDTPPRSLWRYSALCAARTHARLHAVLLLSGDQAHGVHMPLILTCIQFFNKAYFRFYSET